MYIVVKYDKVAKKWKWFFLLYFFKNEMFVLPPSPLPNGIAKNY